LLQISLPAQPTRDGKRIGSSLLSSFGSAKVIACLDAGQSDSNEAVILQRPLWTAAQIELTRIGRVVHFGRVSALKEVYYFRLFFQHELKWFVMAAFSFPTHFVRLYWDWYRACCD
jgi:hypothetical protein